MFYHGMHLWIDGRNYILCFMFYVVSLFCSLIKFMFMVSQQQFYNVYVLCFTMAYIY